MIVLFNFYSTSARAFLMLEFSFCLLLLLVVVVVVTVVVVVVAAVVVVEVLMSDAKYLNVLIHFNVCDEIIQYI